MKTGGQIAFEANYLLAEDWSSLSPECKARWERVGAAISDETRRRLIKVLQVVIEDIDPDKEIK